MRIARLAPSRRVWIFDLDNTLHDATARIFPAMHDQINAVLRREFGVDEAGANRMREEFWLRYGTTLNGLMRHHGIHPRRFLAETHVFPELGDLVEQEGASGTRSPPAGLARLLNAPRHYGKGARAIGLELLRRSVQHRGRPLPGKPALHGFHFPAAQANLDPHRCAFVDDMLENLRTAHRLGMSTVWVSAVRKRVSYVDVRISSVTELPRKIRP